ncbi:unnamed protein product [Dovyalis caffra]|uniref:Uncharacterized protein n=1 Tax=Dovyalis caffra TaxID=77055 RepID=A0AAV1R2I3_9ROSI|nr:unnamed protein product [Dovyalis caffra]
MSSMERLQRIFVGAEGAVAHPPPDSPTLNSSSKSTSHLSPSLKCLNTEESGRPMEVMDLMLREFVDEYTIRVMDLFAMPLSGIGLLATWLRLL